MSRTRGGTCNSVSRYSRAREAYSELQIQRLNADCDAYLPDVLRACGKQVDESSSLVVLDKVKELFPSTSGSKAVKFVDQHGAGGTRFVDRAGGTQPRSCWL